VLTKITAITGICTLIVQGAVLFGWDITDTQQAWITSLVVAIGGAVHLWFNPNVPVGKTEG
jgi:uncharacterized membrane protein YeaQ/YmgE (transglycosylase-associated protein family)